jgi:hypothetical protein
MDLFGSVLFCAGIAMLVLGIAWAVYPMPSLGMARRVDGALAVVAAVAVMGLGWQLRPALQEGGAVKMQASVPTQP